MLVALAACIVPDSSIQVQPNRTNPGTVRIVQAVALSGEANAACAEVPGFEVCPLPQETIVPGLIELENQAFCVCQSGSDTNALRGFYIYVEDPDVDEDGEPRDALLGAFLLDVVPGEEPSQFVAYTNYFPTSRPAQPANAGTYEQPIERPPTNLRSWALGTDTTLDLCNDNNGVALDPGLHNLRLIVTDRPWPFRIEPDGDRAPNDAFPFPAIEEDQFVRAATEDPLVGVPDLPGGASFDVADFVFRCIDETTEQGTSVCNCEEAPG